MSLILTQSLILFVWISIIQFIYSGELFNICIFTTNGIFYISLDETVKYDVTVYNVLGQIVHSGVITNTMDGDTEIDLSFCDKGIYTVELKDNTAVYTEKIIVE